MKKKARTKLPLLAFEAEAWPVELRFRKPATQSRRSDKASRAPAPKALRVARAARLVAPRPSLTWAGPVQGSLYCR